MTGSHTLDAPVVKLTGVGARLEARLNRVGIHTIKDLLFHLPYRYIDQTRLTPIGALQTGQDALTQGMIELTQVQYGRRRSLVCRISDGTGALHIRFFHFSRFQQDNLVRGAYIRCWGSIRRSGSIPEMIHPEYQLVSRDMLEHTETTLTPVYPATEGLAQERLRKLTDQALKVLEISNPRLIELLPEDLLAGYRLPELSRALKYVHRPPRDADVDSLLQGIHPAQQRLAFEELLAHHVSLQSVRKQVQTLRAPALKTDNKRILAFLEQLPFQLTGAQKNVLHEIRSDLQRTIPMLRLIQGDVGSGKTVLAAIAALFACDAGYQAALMAPTELLAEQHCATIIQLLAGMDIPVRLLSGRMNLASRSKTLMQIASPEPTVVVGTHALFQEQVKFGNLGLVIIDEQHRFGVHQRLALYEKRTDVTLYPHQLIMTATPIPRTLMMTVFADLDLSILDELPPGRKPVNTVVLSNARRLEVIKRISAVCKEGRQVYWVCTLIEESDKIQLQAATDTMEYLTGMLPDLKTGLIHGKMKSRDKEKIMSAYKSGELDILVATTVIEVGVDVPAASLMVIENAERLGLSQLHQLRGRVGRGQQHSNCVLMYQPPLSAIARARLEIMRATNDGFVIAEKDMELRGPGEILGTRQTGLPALRIADLVRDTKLIPHVQEAASILLREHPDKTDLLIRRWLPDRQEYGNV
jgi:ATP-dependent DNA helicase RecG